MMTAVSYMQIIITHFSHILPQISVLQFSSEMTCITHRPPYFLRRFFSCLSDWGHLSVFPSQRVNLSFDFPFYGHFLREITVATGGK